MCVLVEMWFCLPYENSAASGFSLSFASSSDMEITASLSSDSGLNAGFLLMRNKWISGIKLKLGFAAEPNLPGEQPKGWGSSPCEGQMSVSGWNKRRKKIWRLSEVFVGMGAALLTEHLVKNLVLFHQDIWFAHLSRGHGLWLKVLMILFFSRSRI